MNNPPDPAFRAAPVPPLSERADQASPPRAPQGGGAVGAPTPLDDDLRDALNDLANENRTSALRINDAKCPLGVCLHKHGYANWAGFAQPGRWRITPLGWLFLETRLSRTGEHR